MISSNMEPPDSAKNIEVDNENMTKEEQDKKEKELKLQQQVQYICKSVPKDFQKLYQPLANFITSSLLHRFKKDQAPIHFLVLHEFCDYAQKILNAAFASSAAENQERLNQGSKYIN